MNQNSETVSASESKISFSRAAFHESQLELPEDCLVRDTPKYFVNTKNFAEVHDSGPPSQLSQEIA